MIGILTWLVGSELGRKVAVTVLAAAALGYVVLRIYSAGKTAERALQNEKSLDNLRNRIIVDDEISKLPEDERRKRLEEWAR